MTDDTFDDFLNTATLEVADLWAKAGGASLSTDGLYALNDALTAHFSGLRTVAPLTLEEQAKEAFDRR